MYIIIGADIVPTESNEQLFTMGDGEALVGKELVNILKASSYNIFNLEVPLTDEEAPIIKHGPNLIAATDTVEGYYSLDINLLSVANNHIMDQGARGLFSSLNVLTQKGIHYVGAGNTLQDAARPFIFSFGEKKIGVYACAEHEFSIASETRPGANPFDPLWSLDHIYDLNKTVDYIIVLYHGGKEHYRYPSPELQKRCRRMIEKGADLVICQHSHCIGCEEKYKEGTIIYGQGNFLFDGNNHECWQTGLLVVLDDALNVDYIPIRKDGNGVKLANDDQKSAILKGFNKRSDEIKTSGFIYNKYSELSDQTIQSYILKIEGKENILFRTVNRILGNSLREKRNKQVSRKKYLAMLLNIIKCEAHNELLSRGLECFIYDRK